MRTLVFDIETIGEDFDSLDQASQHVLTRWIKEQAINDEEKYQQSLTTLKNGLGFSPLTGCIVAIGMYDPARERGAVYYQAPGVVVHDHERDGFKYMARTEQEMLRVFWSIVAQYDEFVTFNGRSFDVPFLMVRSLVHRLRPSKNLVSQRYLDKQMRGARHIDLCDQLSFYGAVWKKPSLHLVCRALGIPSPKTQGVTGEDVAHLFRTKEYQALAWYNARDVLATSEIFTRWGEILR